jgi:hypothetical protein
MEEEIMAEFIALIWFTAIFLFGPLFVIACLVAGTLGAVYGIVVMFRRMSSRK